MVLTQQRTRLKLHEISSLQVQFLSLEMPAISETGLLRFWAGSKEVGLFRR